MDYDRMEAFVLHLTLGKALDPPLQPDEQQTADRLREQIESMGLVVDIPFAAGAGEVAAVSRSWKLDWKRMIGARVRPSP